MSALNYDDIDKVRILTMQMGVIASNADNLVITDPTEAADPTTDPVIICRAKVYWCNPKIKNNVTVDGTFIYHGPENVVKFYLEFCSNIGDRTFEEGHPIHEQLVDLIASQNLSFGELRTLDASKKTSHIKWQHNKDKYDLMTINWADVQGLPDNLKEIINSKNLKGLTIGIAQREPGKFEHEIRATIDEESTEKRETKTTDSPE